MHVHIQFITGYMFHQQVASDISAVMEMLESGRGSGLGLMPDKGSARSDRGGNGKSSSSGSSGSGSGSSGSGRVSSHHPLHRRLGIARSSQIYQVRILSLAVYPLTSRLLSLAVSSH